MFRQIKNLSKLQLCNLYGMNTFRFTKDKQVKRKTKILMVIWIIIIFMLISYVSGLTYGYIIMGLEEMSLAYLIGISSMIMLFLGIFKAGSVIFNKNGYDILCSLPVSQTAIVVSRFVRMYVENLLLALIVMIPGMIVYACLMKPDVIFYLAGIIVLIFLPFAPVTIATFIGAIITAISSRMKHKSLVEAGLSILLVLAVLIPTSRVSGLEGQITPEMIKELSGQALSILKKIYPPAIWMANAMRTGELLPCLGCIFGFLVLFAIMIWVVSANFHFICQSLYGSVAKHNYQIENMKKDSVLIAMYKRELKRYLSSSVYVANTIMGPIMAVIFSGTLLFMGTDSIEQVLPVSIHIENLIPFLVAGIFCIMTTTSTSISMEGKEWWIVKSLPVTTKNILDGKILLNLSLILPFYLVAEVLLIVALKPAVLQMVWLLVIPPVIILFACVFGITMNLKFPLFNWESEVTVVKQSFSAMIGGLGGFFMAIVCAVPVALVPEEYLGLTMVAVCIFVLVITVLLYRKNNGVNLQEI